MTAEIAILSRSAVAIAADSAVTVERQIGPTEVEKRVLKGANKVFALSRKDPVAVMIFGDASFMGVPWETLIKMYRSERGSVSFDTLEQYPRDFFSYLETHDSLFPAEAQDAAALAAMQRYGFMVLGQALRRAADKHITGKRLMNRMVSEEIDSELTFTQKCKFARGFDAKKAQCIKEKYQDQITAIIDDVFGSYRISKARKAKLRNILVAAITRIWFQDASAGIVFAGFGCKQHYPALIAYRCRGVFDNVLLRVRREEKKITSEQTAAIVPFAQTEMVKTFLLGIDPEIMEAINGFLLEAFRSMNKEVRQRAPTAAADVLNVSKAIRKQFDKDFIEYVSENHAQPMHRIVDVLSKDELAELAENLLVMESLKKRITQPIESVGGPIDVAVVSKAEGVIWIKRKHYFERALNEDFFLRRQVI